MGGDRGERGSFVVVWVQRRRALLCIEWLAHPWLLGSPVSQP